MENRIVFSMCIALLLTSCVTPSYQNVGNDNPNQSYEMKRKRFTVDGDTTGSCTIDVYSRVYQSGGKTNICGYLASADEGSCEGLGVTEIAEVWFRAAGFYLGRNVISSASFLDYKDRRGNVPCVQTQTPWRDEFEYSTHRVIGGYVSQ